MEITLREIHNSQESLNKLIELDLPIQASFKLTKIIGKVGIELNQLEEHRNNLVKKHGTENKGNKIFEVLKDKEKEFIIEFNKLLDTNINLEVDPISIDELDGVKFSTKHLYNLKMYFCENKDN